MKKGDDPKSNSNQIRCKKSTSGFLDVIKPNCVEDYNKNMGGTDLADQCFQYYSHTHRSLKWWKRGFFHLLNICIVNARVMFTSIAGNKNVSNLDFRIGIVHGLLLGWQRNATRNLRCYTAIELTVATALSWPKPKWKEMQLHCLQ